MEGWAAPGDQYTSAEQVASLTAYGSAFLALTAASSSIQLSVASQAVTNPIATPPIIKP